MGLVKWAEKELSRIEKDDEGMQNHINSQILDIVKVFSEQGHSGFSAGYALNILKRLLAWKPITPLTGEEKEWNEITDELDQNNRCSAVFRTSKNNSTAYFLDGKIFSDDGGKTWFTSKDSKVPVTFPYIVPEKPERIYLDK